MSADLVDEAQTVAQLFVDCQVSQIRRAVAVTVQTLKCEECDNDIPAARRKAVPGARLCVGCQEVAELRQRVGKRDSYGA
ncbi:TraR/DksA C4-type zinc finger protein [Enterobacter cloacae subsp. dissolvens]|uniref:TraR/DksA C4-type zinc finger protein n=1 Tax=Enterobacter cloacae complex TaxID=354276 RepID=UPI001D070237|nr:MULTISPECIES: TraR/DksA C4-type zinc finger protein [Enterobacter cloacae complex]MDK2357450.1 TraR/DksA C4-type zinc finger protein [Enterobacter hormaechei]